MKGLFTCIGATLIGETGLVKGVVLACADGVKGLEQGKRYHVTFHELGEPTALEPFSVEGSFSRTTPIGIEAIADGSTTELVADGAPPKADGPGAPFAATKKR